MERGSIVLSEHEADIRVSSVLPKRSVATIFMLRVG